MQNDGVEKRAQDQKLIVNQAIISKDLE